MWVDLVVALRSTRVLASNRGKMIDWLDANYCKEGNAVGRRGRLWGHVLGARKGFFLLQYLSNWTETIVSLQICTLCKCECKFFVFFWIWKRDVLTKNCSGKCGASKSLILYYIKRYPYIVSLYLWRHHKSSSKVVKLTSKLILLNCCCGLVAFICFQPDSTEASLKRSLRKERERQRGRDGEEEREVGRERGNRLLYKQGFSQTN